MTKPKIYATGNEFLKGEFNISYYIVEKNEKFLNWLGELLEEVFEIKNGKNAARIVEKEGENFERIIYLKQIDKMIDLHEHYENHGERVDVFYGKDRVYLTLRKSEEVRNHFAKFIRKTRSWIEVSETAHIPAHLKELNNASN